MKNALKQIGLIGIVLIAPLLSMSPASAQPSQLAQASRLKLTPLCSPDYPDGCVTPIRIPDLVPLRCDPRLCDPSPIDGLRIPEEELIISPQRIRNADLIIQKKPVLQIENLDSFRQGNIPGARMKDLLDD